MELGQEPYPSLLLVACRVVPYDQWLITHLDPCWTIKECKNWILSKCNLTRAADAPPRRPVSPITFASATRSGGSVEANETAATEEKGTASEEELDFGYGTSRRERARNHSWRSSSSIGEKAFVVDPKLSTLFSLTKFSTMELLEDEFKLKFYKIRPHELLEVHHARFIVNLPRDRMRHYVKPYFEAQVKALRSIPRKEAPKSASALKIKLASGSRPRMTSSDPLAHEAMKELERQKQQEKTRKKLEWRDRWVVVHQGVLTLCRGRFDMQPAQNLPLHSIIVLKGREHISRSTSATLSKHIVCAKFRSSSKTKMAASPTIPPLPYIPIAPPSRQLASPRLLHSPSTYSPTSGPSTSSSSPVDEFHDRTRPMPTSTTQTSASASSQSRRFGTDTNRSTSTSASISEVDEGESPKVAERNRMAKKREEENGEWIILDLGDEVAFTSFLRILHRASPHPITSSFLPQPNKAVPDNSSGPSRQNDAPVFSTFSPFSETIISSLNSTPFSAPVGAIPYPEWRTHLVQRARRAGWGDVGPAMEWVEWRENAKAISGSFSRLKEDGMGFGRARRDTVGTVTTAQSVASDGTLGAEQGRSGPVGLDDLRGEDEDEELSEDEWKWWMQDLNRQGRVHGSAQREEHRHRNELSTRFPASQAFAGSSSNDSLHRTAVAGSTSASHDYDFLQSPPSPYEDVLTPTPDSPRRHPNTITSSVTVGSPTAPVRQRSSTVTAAGMKFLRKKDKGKGKEKVTEDIDCDPPRKAFTFDSVSSALKANESASPLTDHNPRKSILRHIRSSSHLQRSRDTNPSPTSTTQDEPEMPTDAAAKRRKGIVQGVHAHAERWVRGLDSALDFVDDRVSSGAA